MSNIKKLILIAIGCWVAAVTSLGAVVLVFFLLEPRPPDAPAKIEAAQVFPKIAAAADIPKASKAAPTPLPKAEPRASRNLDDFILVYPPDEIDSTENDRPRPPIVTKWAIYRAEAVKIMASKDRTGWVIFWMSDPDTAQKIDPADAMKRLAGRKR